MRWRASESAAWIGAILCGAGSLAVLRAPDPWPAGRTATAAHAALRPTFALIEAAGAVGLLARATTAAMRIRPRAGIPLRSPR